MSERLFVLLQHLMPKLAMTRLAGRIANWEGGSLTQWIIRRFIARYQVDMNEAAASDPSAYASFNAFFTRALRADARPLSSERLACPVDGAISQFGRIEQGQIFQAKGRSYSAQALLAGDAESARRFDDGHFATIYLSPRDYHRIHMPCDGRLLRMSYVPGELYSVNPATARGVDRLFARNERVVCLFEGQDGRPFALVLVGATIVGSMATVWHGVVNPPRPGQIRHWDYRDQDIRLAKGEEMGRFLLGSTVVLLFPQGPLSFNPAWQAAGAVRMGEAMAD
ncbi:MULTISPECIES: archaetidylserine decarboxylase [Chromobacterium]|uniref:archaetidylserine decarboxylase n=1 Tax=Chromobacterium TaxID=535 RepID=UPI001D05DFFD|nr:MULTISPECIES: archaetidylserine decarboxylase [Chromobacterium]MCP1289592.1 archaetidylserine decarboxylase [Chromobacterium sp. S0633]UJB33182.1 phosphatidylserine decarboxylase [Chromobacterium sp. Beijing]